MTSTAVNNPDHHVSEVIGITGIIIFGLLFLLTSISLSTATNKYSRYLFITSTLTSLLELPRYLALLIQHQYTNQITYSLHLLGSICYFVIFTFVCYLLNDVIDLSNTTTPLINTTTSTCTITTKARKTNLLIIQWSDAYYLTLNKRYLLILNGIFAVLVIVTCVDCILSTSLFSFFQHSLLFFIFTIIDTIKNIIFGMIVFYHGQKLRLRIMRFANHSVTASPTELALNMKLQTVITKLLFVMILCNICFWLRGIMLILKIILVERNESHIHSMPWLPVFGVLWWWLSDFVPRTLPLFFLVLFFCKMNKETNHNNESISKSSNSLDRYRRHLVQIDDTDSNSQPGRENSDDSLLESPTKTGTSQGATERERQRTKSSYSFGLQSFLAALIRRSSVQSDEIDGEDKDALRQRLLHESDSMIISSSAGAPSSHSNDSSAQSKSKNGSKLAHNDGNLTDINRSMESSVTHNAVKGTPNDSSYRHSVNRSRSGHSSRYPFKQQPASPGDVYGDGQLTRVFSGDRDDIEQSFGFDAFSYRSSTTDGGQNLYTDAATSAIYGDGGTNVPGIGRSVAGWHHGNLRTSSSHEYGPNMHHEHGDGRKLSFGGDSSTQSGPVAKHALQWPSYQGFEGGIRGQQNTGTIDMSDTESDV